MYHKTESHISGRKLFISTDDLTIKSLVYGIPRAASTN